MVSRSTIYKQKKKFFCFCFYIIISFPTSSNIFQNDTEMLKKQHYEIQQWHKEEQQYLLYLQEIAKVCYVEHAAQKAKREAEAKAKKETEKWRRRRS